MKKTLKTRILKHANSELPNEACGFLLKGDKYQPCKNVSAHPTLNFEISADDWIKYGDDVIGIVHSHPDNEPFLSHADRVAQAQSGLPWYLVTGGGIKEFKPVPLLRGRLFEYGVTDCASLVADCFHLAGINFQSPERTDLEQDSKIKKLESSIESLGFYRLNIEDIEAGDVVLTSYGNNADHAMLYLGDGEVLHHVMGQLSRVEPYTHYWYKHTHSVWRHKDWKPKMLDAVLEDLGCIDHTTKESVLARFKDSKPLPFSGFTRIDQENS